MPTLTILTPVYNRANLLPRVFDYLQQQTDKDFEWIIIDDGSIDNSLEIANSFETNNFNIRVLSKQNGGKHTALNFSHPYINGKLVFILDSDDYLMPEAVKIVKQEWKKYINDLQVGILIFLKGIGVNNPVCTVSQYNKPVDFMKCRRKYLFGRDCCEVIKADLFKQFPFPEFPGEKFIGESALWNRISQYYKCVYINQIIYICEYLKDGLTKSGKILQLKNPKGGMYVTNLELTKKNSLKKQIKYGILYTCYGKFSNYTFLRMKKECSNKKIFYFTFLLGVFLYYYWNKKFMN